PQSQTAPSVGVYLVRRAASVILPMLVVLALDRISKTWVRDTLWDPPRELVMIPGWLELTPVTNRGIAFGIMQDSGGLLALVAVVALGAIAIKSWRQVLKAPFTIRAPLGLIAGGAFGN